MCVCERESFWEGYTRGIFSIFRWWLLGCTRGTEGDEGLYEGSVSMVTLSTSERTSESSPPSTNTRLVRAWGAGGVRRLAEGREQSREQDEEPNRFSG